MLRKIVEARALVALAMAGGVGAVGAARVPRFAGRRVPRSDRRTRSRGAVRPDLRVRHAVVHHAVLRRVAVDVARGDRRLSPRAERARPAAPAVSRSPSSGPRRSLVLGETHYQTDSGPSAASRVADGPAAGPLHRRHDPRRRRNRQDVRVHVSVRRPTASLASRRPGAKARRPRPGSQRRFLRPGAIHAPPDRTRRGLRRGRARHRRLLQPAAQRTGSLRRRLRDRHAAEQPVRPIEGAVLAAGVHRPAEVRDPPATHQRRLHHVLRGVSLHPGRRADRSGHPPPEGRPRRTAGRARHPCRATSASTASRSRGRTGSPRTRTTWRTRTKPGLETFLAGRKVVYEVRKPKGAGWAARKHQLEAVERWYLHGWSRLDGRLRSSIVEGVVVFLSLFDDSPAVHRAFCPPRSAYTEDPPPENRSRSRRSMRCSRAARCWR